MENLKQLKEVIEKVFTGSAKSAERYNVFWEVRALCLSFESDCTAETILELLEPNFPCLTKPCFSETVCATLCNIRYLCWAGDKLEWIAEDPSENYIEQKWQWVRTEIEKACVW